MRILVAVATMEEAGLLISELRGTNYDLTNDPEEDQSGYASQIVDRKSKILNLSANCTLLITGVGMVATAFSLGQHLAGARYDMVVNFGIAGSFDRSIALGEVVEISTDTFAELGAEDDDVFLPIDQMGFGEAVYQASTSPADPDNLSNNFNLKKVSAITVNTVHGNEISINKVTDRLGPQLESMEGAAVFYACKEADIPCLQIRAVSNYVEKRNRDNWQIGLAIKNLNKFALEFLKLYA